MRCVCPFCGGTLPGKPGQYVKCCHCAETIHWANNRPYRTHIDAQEDAQRLRLERQERLRRERVQKEKEAALATERQEREQEQRRRRSEWIRRQKEWWRNAVGRARTMVQAAAWGVPRRAATALMAGCRTKVVRYFVISVVTLLLTWNFIVIIGFGILNDSQKAGLLYPRTWTALDFFYPPVYWLKTVTPTHARILSNHNGHLYFALLTNISPEAAEMLAKHEGSLYFPELTSISPEVAEALARHEGELYLGGLKTISSEVAEALAKHRGYLVFLDNRQLHSVTIAERFMNHPVSFLDRLPFSPESANKYYNHLAAISPHLTSISPGVAELLAKHEKRLRLDRLTSLSPEVAEALAQHRGGGQLTLPRLLSISPEVAEALAKYKGGLSLGGLETISSEVAEALAKHKGGLALKKSVQSLVQEKRSQKN
jgi:hypothetical protein